MGLKPSSIEEPNAKCSICGAGLNYIENLYYGNRCVICVKSPVRDSLGIIRLCILLWYDLKIHNEIIKIRLNSVDAEDARETVLAALATYGSELTGADDINSIKTIKSKKSLLRALKEVKNWRSAEEIQKEQ